MSAPGPLARPLRVAFRVDASSAIGSGHVMRCMTLATALKERGADILFVSRLHDGHLVALIEGRGFAVHSLPAPDPRWRPTRDAPAHGPWIGASWQDDAAATRAALAAVPWDWLVVDHYGLDARWERPMRALARRILAIDDLADRPHDCDILLDQNRVAGGETRYGRLVPEGATLLLGPAYALLQPDYARLRPEARVRKGRIGRILVFFGGTDPFGLTLKTVRALAAMDTAGVTADIVLAPTAGDFAAVEAIADATPGFTLHARLPSLAPLMLAADLAIGAGGATTWERLCLGLPSLVVTVAENQRPVAETLAKDGLIRWLGDGSKLDQATLADTVGHLLKDGLDPLWSQACLDIVDGLGAVRAVETLLSARGGA